jgi:hypothetical protein
MDELTTEQARIVGTLRLVHPQAEVVTHPRPWGAIVELRLSGPSGRPYTAAIARVARDGRVTPDRPLRAAA